ncbi:complement C1q-like protein 4 [Ruditapes philippinarum]|uniref:complement C1q-like protein 4 n=1 Tax=Ruditapes philippinarum TaxID=129788 RepID=UPI00295B3A9A|nr:complement C1q-like protein 4 [Ruditapes philippinarum]
MKNELDKLHVNERIQAKIIAGKMLKRSKRDEPTCPFSQNQTPVAFTAYLDHRITNLGADQAIVYNKVLLNQGAAYNVYNGVFTAPKSGVYIFSWSSDARKIGATFDIWVSLVVNASTQTTVVAESRDAVYDH